MAMPLLAAKLYLPPPRPRLVARPHLDARLGGGFAKPVTLACAPAGFGKTTLLSAWRAGPARDLAVAWLTLDENDNDPVRFLTYLVTALEQVQQRVGETALGLLQSAPPPPPAVVLTPLLNNLSAVGGPWALVLDDYHTIQNPAVHQALAFVIEHLPPQLHLIIATRTDPPLPLARLRARDQLTEIRAADLRFSLAEASTFFTEVMGLDLAPAEVAALATRTEGWIAGLQLAALALGGPQALPGRADHSQFIEAFTGSHRYVFDYLIEEVLERQTEDLRSFLLETAILERMTGPLCDAVLSDDRPSPPDGARCSPVSGQPASVVLEHLERSNLFLVPLDAERQWYRYHHLFGQLLRSRLQELWPERIPKLHLRASLWYQAHGFPADAIQHALAADEMDRAAALAEDMAPSVYVRGEIATLLVWCQALDETLLAAHPALDIWYAAALSQAGQIEAAQTRLDRIWESEHAPHLRAGAAALQAGLACMRGEMRQAEAFARQAQLDAGLIPALFASGTMAEALASQGKLVEAIATCQEALLRAQPLALQRPWSALVGQLHLQLSQLHYERDELEGAAQHAAAHLSVRETVRDEGQVAYGHAVLARVRQAQGRCEEALEQLEAAVSIAERWDASPALIAAMDQLVEVWLMRGDLAAVREWAQAYQARKEAAVAGAWHVTIRPEIGEAALARALLAIGQPTAALTLVEKLLARLRTGGQWGRLIEVLALQALAFQAQGQLTAALQAVDQALALAEPAGYFRLFVDLGAEMATLLTGLLRARRLGQLPAASGASAKYIRALLAAIKMAEDGRLGTEGTHPSPVAPPAWLIEPLSDRELQVLRLVVSGCSNPEISDHLVITVGTVKRHINTIFSKLGVHTRAQAMARARELKLA